MVMETVAVVVAVATMVVEVLALTVVVAEVHHTSVEFKMGKPSLAINQCQIHPVEL
jgi:hypothetical protein